MSVIWEELKSRKIFKAATLYAAIAWGIIQIADVLLPVVGADAWIMSSMVLMAFAGFPVAMIFGWMIDIQLERKRLSASPDAVKQGLGLRLAEVAFIGTFGLSAAYLYYNSSGEPAKANPQTELQALLSPVIDQKTIAVLPFASFSDVSGDEFFADGLSEELLNVLARNKKLRVAARTSSFQYKNTNINIRKIAQELGVQYVLEGSVRRSGDLIRVTAQLIKADEDVHIFSKSWDRNTTNVFKVQDEIAQSVLNELKVSLLGENDGPAVEMGTQSIEAFAEYSKGLARLRNRGRSDFEDAIVHFQKALQIDPHYAEAKAQLAETYLLQVSYALATFEQASLLAKPLLEEALTINPNLGMAHAVKGLYHWQLAGFLKKEDKVKSSESLTEAQRHLVAAININPSIAEAYMWYGSIMQELGEIVDGVALRKRAYEIDPQAAVVGFNRAQDLIRFGDYKGAMDVFNSVVRNNPNYPQAYAIAGDVSRQVGQLDQAFGMYRRQSELSGSQSIGLIQSSFLLIPLGEFSEAQVQVDKLDAIQNMKYAGKKAWLQAYIWVASQNYPAFFSWTESFIENTQSFEERFWRGFGAMKRAKWKFAIDDLQYALQHLHEQMPKKNDEDIIRIELMLAKAFLESGDRLSYEKHLIAASESITELRGVGIVSHELRYLEAVTAALKQEHERAVNLLHQAIQEGFVDFWWAENDPSFDLVRSMPSYAAVKQEFDIRVKIMQKNIENQFGMLAQAK